MTIPSLNFTAILPEIIVVVTALLVLLGDLLVHNKRLLAWLSLIGIVAAGVASVLIWQGPAIAFQSMAVADGYAMLVDVIVLAAAALGVLLSLNYLGQFSKQQGEYYALLLLAVSGMMSMAAATDMITLFVSLEILSLSLYVLAGFNRHLLSSAEAALKYFLLGAFASAFFLYGAALLYGATGSTDLTQIAAVLQTGQPGLMPYLGAGLLLVGFGFKVALVPFHMWTPDVYQGAPTPITAFMSAGTKTAAFAAFLRVFFLALPSIQVSWTIALAVLSILTMTLGNLAALRQTSLKRMLAYSSIAHAGYILVGLAAGNQAGINGALFYLFAYVFMNIGAFAVVEALEQAGEMDAVMGQADGLAVRQPGLAAAMAIFMLSLAGVPPLAGFVSKLYVFNAAVQAGWTWLAVIGVVNSVISAYYYLRVTVAMYMREPAKEWSMPLLSLPVAVVVVLAAVGTVALGVWPGSWTAIVQQSVAAFLAG
ncbi:MAG TPA: NADH-quinone oxidoreductase subunit N [Anaerolineae bacterium]|nr:NADH-quinone oxidoreductase subunit N [Anaerolineae bacterium]